MEAFVSVVGGAGHSLVCPGHQETPLIAPCPVAAVLPANTVVASVSPSGHIEGYLCACFGICLELHSHQKGFETAQSVVRSQWMIWRLAG